MAHSWSHGIPVCSIYVPVLQTKHLLNAETPTQWVETHLEETGEKDVLMLPEEMSSLNIDGYVAHPLFALVVLIEYTVR